MQHISNNVLKEFRFIPSIWKGQQQKKWRVISLTNSKERKKHNYTNDYTYDQYGGEVEKETKLGNENLMT